MQETALDAADDKCVVCLTGAAMAGCSARWCQFCYFACLDTVDICEHTARCGELHEITEIIGSMGGGGAAASAGGAVGERGGASAPAEPLSVAKRYRTALAGAGLPLGHAPGPGHARQFAFTHVESDKRRGERTARAPGATLVSTYSRQPWSVSLSWTGSSLQRVAARGKRTTTRCSTPVWQGGK